MYATESAQPCYEDSAPTVKETPTLASLSSLSERQRNGAELADQVHANISALEKSLDAVLASEQSPPPQANPNVAEKLLPQYPSQLVAAIEQAARRQVDISEQLMDAIKRIKGLRERLTV